MKKFLSLVLALVMTMSLVTVSAGAKDFTDGDKITYDVAIDVMSAVKVIDGYEDGSFKPAATLTRGAAAKIICNLILGPTTAGALVADTAPYKDVPANSTFAGYIAYCQKEGIISGYADGTFKPGATLTGYAFMKMLLGALGYDASVEGYTGANWSINVAKRALAVGLADDLSGDFDGTKPVTRQEACLYAFNTLQADLVEYDTTITVGDITIAGSKANAVTSTLSYADNIKDENTNPLVVQFGEKYFSNLTATSTSDKFGRPSTEWKLKKDHIAYEVKTPDLTYTTAEKGKSILEDLDTTDTSYFYYVIDGVSVDNTYKLTFTTGDSGYHYTGNGVVTEVYYDDAASSSDNKVVFINEYIGKITKVAENSKDERYVRVNGLDFVTENFAKGDWVVYTLAGGKIQSMSEAELVTGKLTKNSKNEKLTIAGTEYEMHLGVAANSVPVGKTVDAYLDSNGYIIKIAEADSSVKLENMGIILNNGTDYGQTWVKVLKTDNTKQNLDTDKAYNYDITDAYKNMRIVEWTLDDGEYELADRTTYYGYYNFEFETGSAYIAVGNTRDTTDRAVRVDAKTVFIVYELDGDSTVYVGNANMPDLESGNKGVSAYYKDGNTATGSAALVVVHTNENLVAGSNTNRVYLLAKDKADLTKIVDDDRGTYYTFSAIQKGVGEITVDVDKDNTYIYEQSELGNAVLIFENLKTTSKGIVKDTSVNSVDAYTVKFTGVDEIDTDRDIVTFYTTGTYTSYTLADDAEIYTVDGDDIEAIDITEIIEDDDNTASSGLDAYEEIYLGMNDKGKVEMVIMFLN